MKYLPSDKYNVAWFKLAECVSRREKERALGVYRLLSHSIDDQAFVHQLEGDILAAFGDLSGAVQQYQNAAELYKKDGRLFEAAAMNEHIFLLSDDKRLYAARLVKLYKELHIVAKAAEYAQELVKILIQTRMLDAATEAMDEWDEMAGPEYTVFERQKLVFAMIEYGRTPLKTMIQHAQKVIDAFLKTNDTQQLRRFLHDLELADAQVYGQICRPNIQMI
jgi:hypothetical protein